MNTQKPAKCWLGREDSNLRMPVPKTGVNDGNPGDTLRNAPVIHTLESKAYSKSAEGDPTFTTRAELEAWAVETAHWANCTPDQTMRARLEALDLIRRVTLAHVHLKEG